MPSPTASSDGQVFDRWVCEHAAVLYRVAIRQIGDRHDAEDVVQDAFRSAWLSRDLYDRSRSERAWLLAILRRRVVDHWRKKGSVETVTSGDLVQSARADADPFGDELSGSLQEALETLPPEMKETLLLVVVGELTHQEAADLQNIPLGTVLSRVSRARARLRQHLLARTTAVASRHRQEPGQAGGAMTELSDADE